MICRKPTEACKNPLPIAEARTGKPAMVALKISQALHRPSHTRHSHHAGSGVGCVMYTLEGTKRSSGPAGNFARNGRRTA